MWKFGQPVWKQHPAEVPITVYKPSSMILSSMNYYKLYEYIYVESRREYNEYQQSVSQWDLLLSFNHNYVIPEFRLDWRICVDRLVTGALRQIECSVLKGSHHWPSSHPAEVTLQSNFIMKRINPLLIELYLHYIELQLHGTSCRSSTFRWPQGPCSKPK